jgi:hypothetical protein
MDSLNSLNGNSDQRQSPVALTGTCSVPMMTDSTSHCSRLAPSSRSLSVARRSPSSKSPQPSLLVILLVLLTTMTTTTNPNHSCGIATAFVAPRSWPSATRTSRRHPRSTRGTSSPDTALFVEVAKQKGILPPPPEDQLTMSGDVFALFLYSFMDHSMNDLYKDVLTNSGMDSARSLDPLNEFGTSTHILPVWYDHVHTLLPPDQLLTLLAIPNVNYAPLLQTAGAASVAMTTCWLLAGWWSGAFLLRNTLECHISRMLIVTGKTWLLTTLFMCVLAYGSDAALLRGSAGCTSHACWAAPAAVGGLTKADVDYIFDSLTVLITWRFMVSALFGGFTKK